MKKTKARLKHGVILSIATLTFICTPANADAVIAWGLGIHGRLGNGMANDSTTPVSVFGMSSDAKSAVSAGFNQSLAFQDGTAKAWGNGSSGQLGNGSSGNSSVPIAVAGLENYVTEVSAGAFFSLAIRDGAAVAWGSNQYGQLGNGSYSESSTPVQVFGLHEGVTAIAAGFAHNLAITHGAVKAWGAGGSGRLGNGTTNVISAVPVDVTGLDSGVTAIAAGSVQSIAIQNGAAKAWGAGYYIGNGTNGGSSVPVNVSGLNTGVTAIAAGYRHSLAIKDGNVYSWGDNANGALGNGPGSPASSTPILALDLPMDLVSVSAGSDTSFALTGDGQIYAWGYNQYGQLGLGDRINQYTPRQSLAPVGYRFTSVDAGESHALATIAPRTQFGDANLDGAVNFDDLLALAQNYGMSTGATWSTGDFDLDNAVNFSDLLALAQHYGENTPDVLAGSSTDFQHDWTLARSLVPEPTTFTIAASASAFQVRRRR